MKRKKRNDLTEAEMLFAARKYAQVISLLSPQIFLYRKDHRYHRLLGFACLYTGDFGGAHSYFQRAYDIDAQDIPTLLGLAVVMLRRRKSTEALRLWLEVLDIDPENRRARKALDMAKLLEEDEWLDIIEHRRYGAILPRHPRLISRLVLRWGAVLALIAAAVVAGFVLYSRLSDPGEYRPGQELLEFNMEDYGQGDYSRFASIILTDRELEADLTDIERLFRQFRDNMVRYRGNRDSPVKCPVGGQGSHCLASGPAQFPRLYEFSG
jgi:tetratricopeptide (TPR) repeat protein